MNLCFHLFSIHLCGCGVESIKMEDKDMKKYLIIIIILLFTACEKVMNYDYYIINSCNEEISVYFEINSNRPSYKGPNSIFISSHENKLIYYGTGINKLQDRSVEYFFTKITIYKGDKISKLNYINKDMWKFELTSKSHANSYLTINPEDFE